MVEGLEMALRGEEAPAVADPMTPLIQRCVAGDHSAFEELMSLTEKRVLALAWRLLGDRDLARDAAQEVFLRVYRSLSSFRLGESFQAWLNRITVNVCNDQARKRGPFMSSAEDLELAAEHAPADALLLQEQHRKLLNQALGTLSPAERNALVLRDLQGLSTEEVSQTLGVRPVTVRTQICSARAKLQNFCSRLMQRKGGP